MKIDETGRVARLYRFSWRVWRRFVHDAWWDDVPASVDLWTLVRTIVLGMPLAIVANVAVVGFALYAVFVLADALLPHLDFLGAFAAVIGAVGALLGLLWVVAWGCYRIASTSARTETARVGAAYIKARKERLCPIVEIAAKEGSDASA